MRIVRVRDGALYHFRADHYLYNYSAYLTSRYGRAGILTRIL
jgi:hypothetical protein